MNRTRMGQHGQRDTAGAELRGGYGEFAAISAKKETSEDLWQPPVHLDSKHVLLQIAVHAIHEPMAHRRSPAIAEYGLTYDHQRIKGEGAVLLFDERDLRVFDNPESKEYFKEILQLYYGRSYRATVVMLYSFVIYDLFMKLQTMANEGDAKAKTQITSINNRIANDEQYSKIENEIIEFFKTYCPLYFNRFIEDIEYLKKCRNKCAHLKVNDNSLYIPSDYHAKMLICSMYDNILSVKAPFIIDLFSIAQNDVEAYSKSILSISLNGLDECVCTTIRHQYLERMTYESLKKSYKTFIHLLFVAKDENAADNACGLYAFVFAMTDYLAKNGYQGIFSESSVLGAFSKIEIEDLKANATRKNALISIATTFPSVMDIIRTDEKLFTFVSESVTLKPQGLRYYRSFYPRSEQSTFAYFKENSSVQDAGSTRILFDSVRESSDFDLAEFMTIMVKAIPKFDGFDDANCFMSFFIENLDKLANEDINNVMDLYNLNRQCTNRTRHANDIAKINAYLEETSDGPAD